MNLGSSEVACISCVTEAELWYGLARINAGKQRCDALRVFLERLQVLPWGRDQAATYGAFRAKQEALGKPLGPLDTQIAAHAISVGAVLISHDSAFRQAVGLPDLQDWAHDV
jgi:tRNA(fMet)-specific endonuclease VapC